MAAVSSPRSQWRAVLSPGWVCWHVFAVAAFLGLLWLGDWQLHRALSGNVLSWAYTFEWPLFDIFGVYFWFRTVRDELRRRAGLGEGAAGAGLAGPNVASSLAASEDDAGLTASHRLESESEQDYAARLIAEIRAPSRGWWRAAR
jgi:hypothetical protein